MSAAVLAILRWQTLDVDPPISPRRSRIKRVWLVCKWWMKKQRKSEIHCAKHQFHPPPTPAHPPKKKIVLALMIPVMRLCWFMGRGKKQSLSRFNGQIHLAPCLLCAMKDLYQANTWNISKIKLLMACAEQSAALEWSQRGAEEESLTFKQVQLGQRRGSRHQVGLGQLFFFFNQICLACCGGEPEVSLCNPAGEYSFAAVCCLPCLKRRFIAARFY